MNINQLLVERNMSIYKLAKLSDLPYSTVKDICSSKTLITKCTAETVYKLSIALNVSMETLIKDQIETDNS